MERKYSVTGFCPKANKDIKVSATYVFNTNVWEKGISELPCSSPCNHYHLSHLLSGLDTLLTFSLFLTLFHIDFYSFSFYSLIIHAGTLIKKEKRYFYGNL